MSPIGRSIPDDGFSPFQSYWGIPGCEQGSARSPDVRRGVKYSGAIEGCGNAFLAIPFACRPTTKGCSHHRNILPRLGHTPSDAMPGSKQGRAREQEPTAKGRDRYVYASCSVRCRTCVGGRRRRRQRACGTSWPNPGRHDDERSHREPNQRVRRRHSHAAAKPVDARDGWCGR